MRRVVVLDLETAPEQQALCLLRSEKGVARATWAIQRIEGLCMLVAEERGGRFAVTDFVCADREAPREIERHDETAMLNLVADHLDPSELRTTLVTYNGRRHDLPILRRRAFVNSLSHRPAFQPYPPFDHEDAMLNLGPDPMGMAVPLIQAAGGLGIPVMHRFPTQAAFAATPRMRKCQVDVLATFLLHLQTLSARSGNPDIFDNGWEAVCTFLGRIGAKGDHLLQFIRMQERRLAALLASPTTQPARSDARSDDPGRSCFASPHDRPSAPFRRRPRPTSDDGDAGNGK